MCLAFAEKVTSRDFKRPPHSKAKINAITAAAVDNRKFNFCVMFDLKRYEIKRCQFFLISYVYYV